MKGNAFSIFNISTGILAVNAVAYSAREVRRQAIEIEREYLLDEEQDLTDQKIWKRLYGYGFRVVPVLVTLVSSHHQPLQGE